MSSFSGPVTNDDRCICIIHLWHPIQHSISSGLYLLFELRSQLDMVRSVFPITSVAVNDAIVYIGQETNRPNCSGNNGLLSLFFSVSLHLSFAIIRPFSFSTFRPANGPNMHAMIHDINTFLTYLSCIIALGQALISSDLVGI